MALFEVGGTCAGAQIVSARVVPTSMGAMRFGLVRHVGRSAGVLEAAKKLSAIAASPTLPIEGSTPFAALAELREAYWPVLIAADCKWPALPMLFSAASTSSAVIVSPMARPLRAPAPRVEHHGQVDGSPV